jgi:hypothetical protein
MESKAMIDESCCSPRACMLMLLVASLYDTYVVHDMCSLPRDDNSTSMEGSMRKERSLT